MYFFANAWPMRKVSQDTPTIPDGFLSLVLITLGLVIVAEIVLQVVFVIGQGSAPSPTAQEQLASLKANRVPYGVLITGALAVVGLYTFGFSAFYMANAAMLAMFLAEIIRFASQLSYARQDS
jgi:quinol-cytochrome oxidoreductase complex cytochrome b subunit